MNLKAITRPALCLLLAACIGATAHPTGDVRATQSDPDVPRFAWTRPIGQPFSGAGHQKTNYKIIDDGPIQGAPLGGMGAGTIGRTFAGDFARYQLDIGTHVYKSDPVNMFSVFTKRGSAGAAQALYSGAPDDATLAAWNWNYPVGQGTYWALYPRSGFSYSGMPVQLSVEQFSPVIPGDYQASSYPVAVFDYTATNPGKEPVTVGLMFTWQNMLGPDGVDTRGLGLTSQVRTAGDLTAVVFGRKDGFTGEEWNGSMAIAAQAVPGVTVGTFAGFKANGDGADIWSDFAADGALNDTRQAAESERRSKLGAGVSATFTLQPGQSLKVPFYLAWDQPVMTFGNDHTGDGWYKRYTHFFKPDGAQAFNIALEAARKQAAWHQAILDFQTPILNDPALPDWYKTALFNELYYMVDGGTAWENGRVGDPAPAPDSPGGFLMLECFDYLFYSTFDVDFYASFALLQLWPKLEKQVIKDFAATEPLADDSTFIVGASHATGQRKVAGATPHDLGSPVESPWLKPNAYTWQDVNRWKDLNAKFVLRLYRDAVLLKAPNLVVDNFAIVKQAMAYLGAMDKDGDGIPENEGIPDQTYDTWPATGISAYSGGLWLAALRASADMAKMVGDPAAEADYEAQLVTAQAAYEKALWTGSYYDYDDADENADRAHDSIMADQLAGQWYLDSVGREVLPADHVLTALKTIYKNNVAGFMDGGMGAVNGTRPDGSIDTSSEQSQEVWTGTTYALASTMMSRGLRDEAWKTAYGVYNAVYQTYGYWFRTPEAYDRTGNFRASMYMRPLSIWAIEWFLQHPVKG